MVKISTLAVLPLAPSGLSRQHRAWVALYSLHNDVTDRQQVLLQNNITEADLVEHSESWQQLRLYRRRQGR